MKTTFKNKGTFQAYYAARKYSHDIGYSTGSMCGSMPIALKKGIWAIAKWRNLTGEERLNIDGRIISNDFREGPVIVEIFN